jgi:5'-nucleotidase
MTPVILVTNDDGIYSKGIQSLVEVACTFGDVLIVAPDKPQSGMGHAITINQILRLDPARLFPNQQAYTCSGTPVDCVKLGIYEVLNKKPDLILSGINHGENSSTNVLYSGTMSAAIEGAMENVPSIGFSLSDYSANADFSEAKQVVNQILREVLTKSLPDHICLNVNIPKKSNTPLKGIKVCQQAHAFWEDRFDKRQDQFGRDYYWMSGDFLPKNPLPGSDLEALSQGYVSVVPTQFDLTSYTTLESIKTIFS